MCPYRAAESQGVPVTQIERFPDSLSSSQAPYPPSKRHSCEVVLLSAATHRHTTGLSVDSRPIYLCAVQDWGESLKVTR